MPDDALNPDATLYERDFALWAEAQARALAEGRARDLDWDHLAEEIDSLGRAQKNEIASRLRILIAHLLKWAHQPEKRSHSWQTTIGEQRTHIRGLIETSPSLQAYPESMFAAAYERGRRLAAQETRMPLDRFPAQPEFDAAEALDDGFMPGPDWSPEDLAG